MNQYIEPIKTALVFFPFVALLITLPYMFVQYRKYGAILLLRTAIIYSFVLYLMCAYFLVILPLPDVEMVRGLTSPTVQLIPFNEVAELFSNPAVNLRDSSTWHKLVWCRGFFQIVANVAMLAPLGVYLRYYFGFSCGSGNAHVAVPNRGPGGPGSAGHGGLVVWVLRRRCCRLFYAWRVAYGRPFHWQGAAAFAACGSAYRRKTEALAMRNALYGAVACGAAYAGVFAAGDHAGPRGWHI